MAVLHSLAFAFLAVTLLGKGFSVTDEEFQVGFITLHIALYKFCPSTRVN